MIVEYTKGCTSESVDQADNEPGWGLMREGFQDMLQTLTHQLLPSQVVSEQGVLETTTTKRPTN